MVRLNPKKGEMSKERPISPAFDQFTAEVLPPE